MAVFLKSDGTKLRDTTSFFVMATDLENDITKITPKISENSDRFFYQEAVEGNELFYVDNVTFNSNLQNIIEKINSISKLINTETKMNFKNN